MAEVETVDATAQAQTQDASNLPRLLKEGGEAATKEEEKKPADAVPTETEHNAEAYPGDAAEEVQLEVQAVPEHSTDDASPVKKLATDDPVVLERINSFEKPSTMTWREVIGRTLMFFACLYGFLLGLVLMGDAFKVLGGKGASALFSAIDNPVAGLTVGILVTVLVQSSSTCTSIVVGLVGAGQLDVGSAIPVIMGANIGTSVTNTLVSMGQSGDRDDLERAFAAATVHDMFNLLSVGVLFPLEILVGAIQGIGGPIYWLTDIMTNAFMKGTGGGGSTGSPIKVITKPLTNLLIQNNKYVIKSLSYGMPRAAEGNEGFCLSGAMKTAWHKVDHDDFDALTACSAAGQTACEDMMSGSHCYLAADEFYKSHIQSVHVVSGGVLEGLGDTGAGLVALIVALTLLIGSLFFLVKALHSLMMGRARHCIMRAVNLNDVLAMFVGAVVTLIVQSSSVVTSALTPLAGVGALELKKMLPLTLGANIGTCITGILASLAIMQRDAIQIALCHLVFNIFGILFWFPAPPMRRVPIAAAELLGLYASFYRYVPALYIGVAFVVVPGIALALSVLLDASLVAGIVVMFLLLAALAAFLWWWVVKEGCYRVLSKDARANRFLQRTASEEAEELEWERTYSDRELPSEHAKTVAVAGSE